MTKRPELSEDLSRTMSQLNGPSASVNTIISASQSPKPNENGHTQTSRNYPEEGKSHDRADSKDGKPLLITSQGAITNGSLKPSNVTAIGRKKSSLPYGSGERTTDETNVVLPTDANTRSTAQRGVQFMCKDDSKGKILQEMKPKQQQSLAAQDNETSGKDKSTSALLSKLKTLATPLSHVRTTSDVSVADQSATEGKKHRSASVGYDPQSTDYFQISHTGENDADAEESPTEELAIRQGKTKKKTKNLRLPIGDDTEAPGPSRSPKTSSFFRDINVTGTSSSPGQKSGFLQRAITAEPQDHRQMMSEDESRGRLSDHRLRRANSVWSHSRGPSYNEISPSSPMGSPGERRPRNFRRLTGFVNGPDGTPSSKRVRNDRTTTISVQKWRQLKAGFKLLGAKKRDDNKVDHAKSAELIAELLAGAPSVLMLASMFQRDEHNKKRIPVLLDQLKLHISESQGDVNESGDRHAQFKIELEYGSGLTRMKWEIHRTLRDFTNLHIRYGINIRKQKYVLLKPNDPSKGKLPRFPRSTFPYMRGMRGLFDGEEEEEEENVAGEGSGLEAESSGIDRSARLKSRPSALNTTRRKSSFVTGLGGGTDSAGAGGAADNRRDTFSQRQRKKLESYLYQLIRWCILRPEGNRLCRFLELSVLGIRLAPEGGYHGKEGRLMIKSSKRMHYRTVIPPAVIANRFTRKWFLVRHSYIVSVDAPEDMTIHDVFLVDSDFSLHTQRKTYTEQNGLELAKAASVSALHPKHHQLNLRNAERKLKLLSKSEKIVNQFEESIRYMMSQTIWSKIHRFESFAPVRRNVYAQWLVDGRDYMWNVSRALEMATDVIYIHDWWLSPELYMRRPPAISQKWRLDRILQRKAQEGVKVFVIMYRNINSAIPIDSEYSKFSLLDLHPNIFVQRSPNQMRQNTFFWAHHEKICAIDHTIAFCGGVDLCFSRWDTPQHCVIDDKETGFDLAHAPKDPNDCQIWPGKDYSNPRVQDFYALDKPFADMYDRAKIPRMPWHDVGMQIVGQPARDITRHFVQRWNYILRQRKPTRPTPFLLPPPDFAPEELHALGLDGTCEVQILRSACAWSIGTPNKTEHSIMNAYVKMIETSEHFVYLENQFFISTCEMEGSKIENLIGDALVRRIIRAHREDQDWRAVIIIPLMPGFQNTVDSADGGSVRIIMQWQFRSISRGPSSIFGRLRDAGIEPEDYIQFFSLRSWGKIGRQKGLVTEQLYIHAKIMVVDDRTAIIGSANINERSMLGSRDSEVAAIIRDTEMLPSYMGGEPYEVGRFPHTLRMRLMREHLGIDVDHIMEEEREAERKEDTVSEAESSRSSAHINEHDPHEYMVKHEHNARDELLFKTEHIHSFNHDAIAENDKSRIFEVNKKPTSDPRVTDNEEHKQDVRGEGVDRMLEHAEKTNDQDARDSVILPSGREVIVSGYAPEGKGSIAAPATRKREYDAKTTNAKKHEEREEQERARQIPPTVPRINTEALGLTTLSQLPPLPIVDDSDIGGPPLTRTFQPASADVINPTLATVRQPFISTNSMKDPLSDESYIDTWYAVAENNTKLFRLVFRCQPDSEVKNWRDYKEYANYAERFSRSQGTGNDKSRLQQDAPVRTGPPGSGKSKNSGLQPDKLDEKLHHAGHRISEKSPVHSRAETPLSKVQEWSEKRAQQASFPATMSEKSALHEDDEFEIQPSNTSANIDHEQTPAVGDDDGKIEGANSSMNERAAPASNIKTALADANTTMPQKAESQRRRRRTTTKSSGRAFSATDYVLEKAEAEELMSLVRGHLVLWPYDWYVYQINILDESQSY